MVPIPVTAVVTGGVLTILRLRKGGLLNQSVQSGKQVSNRSFSILRVKDMGSDDYVTKAEFYRLIQRDRDADFQRKRERDKKAHERWQREHERLMNPPPPPSPRREEPREPTVEDIGYVDWLYARGGALAVETKESDDEDIVTRHRTRRRSSTTGSKGSKRLVDSYT
jgi:hypothetical protein